MIKCKDQLNRSIEFLETPKRIISLVPSQTELLCDLGLEPSLVGITKFCVHPSHLIKNKTVVGGTKQINLEKIAKLKPDIILCNKEENTLKMIQELKKIATVHISDVYNIQDCTTLIEMYGKLFSVADIASQIIETIRSKQLYFIKFIESKPKLKVAYFIWRDPWMVAGSNTFINSMLELNNFENVFSDLKRYPKVSLPSAVMLKKVEAILLSSEPYPFREKHVEELRFHFPKARIILVDGEYFSWYGSRLNKAFDYFFKLHQDFLQSPL